MIKRFKKDFLLITGGSPFDWAWALAMIAAITILALALIPIVPLVWIGHFAVLCYRKLNK